MFIFLWLKTLKLAELDIQVWQGHKQLDPNISLVEVTPPVSPQAGISGPFPLSLPKESQETPTKIIKNSGITPLNTHCIGIDSKQGAFKVAFLGCRVLSHEAMGESHELILLHRRFLLDEAVGNLSQVLTVALHVFWIIQWTHILLPEFVELMVSWLVEVSGLL